VVARHKSRDVPLIVDVAIGLALCGTVTFFTLVMEYHVGRGELTRAGLHLLEQKTLSAHDHTVSGVAPKT
jgi:hypothetical protein